ncbi:hypothetical protein GDO86_005167 [Hymenochirus boettgeri]|uniref:Caldesmon n=1 Tax=Hymenochirus boettgeri TaxID=247094 RepID=A0A8T2J6D4_9PIPI|nr:hypothetical protein GDO86_005167 [Hymenochirus boettgeri]
MDDFERRREQRRQKREEMRLEAERVTYQRNDDDDEEAARERRRRARQERQRIQKDEVGDGTEVNSVTEGIKSTITNTDLSVDDEAALLDRLAKREERRQKRLKEAMERQKEFDPTITEDTFSFRKDNRNGQNEVEENNTFVKEEEPITRQTRYEIEETEIVTKSYQTNDRREEEEGETIKTEGKEEVQEEIPQENLIEDNQVEMTFELKNTNSEFKAVNLEVRMERSEYEKSERPEADGEASENEQEDSREEELKDEADRLEAEKRERREVEERERAEAEEKERLEAERIATAERERLEAEEREKLEAEEIERERQRQQEEAERKAAEERAEKEKEEQEERERIIAEQKKAEEERIRLEEEQRKAEEERKKAEEEKKRLEEEQRKLAEQKKRAEEEKLRLEAEQRKALEEKKKAEEREMKRAEEKRATEERERKKSEEERARLETKKKEEKVKTEEKKDKKFDDKQVKEKKEEKTLPAFLRKQGEDKEAKVDSKKDKITDEKLRPGFRKDEVKEEKFIKDKGGKEELKASWERKKGLPETKAQNGESVHERTPQKLKQLEKFGGAKTQPAHAETDSVPKAEADKRLDDLRRRRGETESGEFEKLKQKQQEASVELEELKKRREERRKIQEEEDQKKKQEEADRKAREEEEKKRLKEEIEKRRAEAAEKRSKLPEDVITDEKKPFKCFTPKGSALKIEERAEFLNKSAQRSSIKSGQPATVSKIDSRLEQYTSALGSNKSGKPTKQAPSDLPLPVDGVRNIKSMWEKGNVFSSPGGALSPNKETAGLKVGVSSRINEWLTKTPETNKTASSKPSDLRPGDVSGKRNIWEKQQVEKTESPAKVTTGGKKSDTNGLRFEKEP